MIYFYSFDFLVLLSFYIKILNESFLNDFVNIFPTLFNPLKLQPKYIIDRSDKTSIKIRLLAKVSSVLNDLHSF